MNKPFADVDRFTNVYEWLVFKTKQQGLTIPILAERVGCSRTCFSRWGRLQVQPSREVLQAVGEVLGDVDTALLLGGYLPEDIPAATVWRCVKNYRARVKKD